MVEYLLRADRDITTRDLICFCNMIEIGFYHVEILTRVDLDPEGGIIFTHWNGEVLDTYKSIRLCSDIIPWPPIIPIWTRSIWDVMPPVTLVPSGETIRMIPISFDIGIDIIVMCLSYIGLKIPPPLVFISQIIPDDAYGYIIDDITNVQMLQNMFCWRYI